RRQHQAKQPRANQLALSDLERRRLARRWLTDAVDVVAEIALVVAVDAQHAELRSRERVNVDREPERVLARDIGAAHGAVRVRRRERRARDAERAEIATGFVKRHGERAIDDERLATGEGDAADRAGELDGDRDARSRGALVGDVARVELGEAVAG